MAHELLDLLPLGSYCLKNCHRIGIYQYALDNDLPENIDAQSSTCKQHCEAFKVFYWIKSQNGKLEEELKSVLA